MRLIRSRHGRVSESTLTRDAKKSKSEASRFSGNWWSKYEQGRQLLTISYINARVPYESQFKLTKNKAQFCLLVG